MQRLCFAFLLHRFLAVPKLRAPRDASWNSGAEGRSLSGSYATYHMDEWFW
jgi:hypothetical protein